MQGRPCRIRRAKYKKKKVLENPDLILFRRLTLTTDENDSGAAVTAFTARRGESRARITAPGNARNADGSPAAADDRPIGLGRAERSSLAPPEREE